MPLPGQSIAEGLKYRRGTPSPNRAAYRIVLVSKAALVHDHRAVRKLSNSTRSALVVANFDIGVFSAAIALNPRREFPWSQCGNTTVCLPGSA